MAGARLPTKTPNPGNSNVVPTATESIPYSNGNGINSVLQRQRNKFRTPTAVDVGVRNLFRGFDVDVGVRNLFRGFDVDVGVRNLFRGFDVDVGVRNLFRYGQRNQFRTPTATEFIPDSKTHFASLLHFGTLNYLSRLRQSTAE